MASHSRKGTLQIFLEDLDVPIDSNAIGRQIRLISLGRNYPRSIIIQAEG
jgi:hypothetical protein